MELKNIKSLISKLSIKERQLLVSELKTSYSIFHEYSDVTKCPHCGTDKFVKNGIRGGVNKYLCKNQYCKKNFTFRTGTILSGIQNLNKWNLFVEDFMSLNITPLEELKTKIGVNSKQTLLDWRHKLLSSISSTSNLIFNNDTVEFDEANFLISRKGRQNMNIEDKSIYKNWRRNQVGDSKYNVKMFVSFGRNNKSLELFQSHMGRTNTKHMVDYFGGNKFQDVRMVTDKHITYKSFFKSENIEHGSFLAKNHINFEDKAIHNQTVNAYIREFKQFVNDRLKGVSTKYISNYAKWFQFIQSVKTKIEKTSKLRFDIIDNICEVVLNDNKKVGLTVYRSSEVNFVDFLVKNGRSNFGECRYHYFGVK